MNNAYLPWNQSLLITLEGRGGKGGGEGRGGREGGREGGEGGRIFGFYPLSQVYAFT